MSVRDGLGKDVSSLSPYFDALPSHSSLAVCREELETLLDDLLLGVEHGLDLALREELLESFQIDSLAQLSFGNQQFHRSVVVVRSADHHAVGVEPSESSGLQVGHHKHLSSHHLERDELLQA